MSHIGWVQAGGAWASRVLSLHVCPRSACRSCVCRDLEACLHGLLLSFVLLCRLFYNSLLTLGTGPPLILGFTFLPAHFMVAIMFCHILLPSCSAIFSCHSCCNDLILPSPFGPTVYSFPNGLTRPWAFLPMGSCVLFFLGNPWPICLPWASSTLLLTLYSHGLLLTLLGFLAQLLHTLPWGLWVCHQSPTFFACIALGLPQPILTFFTSHTTHGFATHYFSLFGLF